MFRAQVRDFTDWKRFVPTLLAVISIAASAFGQSHIDVTFQENESDGRLSVHGRDFDQLPEFRLVPDKRVFGRSFLLSGNTLVQDDPGFTASANGVEIDPFFLDPPVNNEPVHFQISAAPSFLTELGGRNLSYWDGNGSVSWGPVPSNEEIKISVDRSDPTKPMASADGSTNDIPGFVISTTDGAGSIHTHIDFELDPDNGDDGVYLLLLEGTLDPYAEWVPFWITFEGFAGGASTLAAAMSDIENDLLFPLCSDGIDNDRDGNIDFPADGGCDDANDMSERGAMNECDNGIDDDMDGLIDHPNDPGCATAMGTMELPEPGMALSLLAGGGLVGLLGRRPVAARPGRMNDPLTALAFALLVGAGAFAAHRIWVRARAVRRLDAEGAELTTSLRDGAIPAWVPAGVGAVVGFAVASLFFGTSVMIALAAGFDLAALVYVGFAVRASSRELRSEQQLGDALRLMTAALRAGASPNDALERAAAQVGAPIGPRLAEAAGKLRLGEDAKEVLGALGRESHLDSLRLFSQALAVQWRAGGSLQRTLTTVGAFVRDRVELQRRIESQIAPTRSSVLILAGATAAVAFLSWSNDPLNIERFVASSVGNLGIAICLGLQGLSFLWMWNLSRFENG